MPSVQNLPLVSGPIRGGEDMHHVAVLDAQAISGNFSGRFFTFDSNGYAVICTDSSQTISGWLESGTVASASSTVCPAIIAPTDAIFRVPCSGAAFTQTYVGQLVDCYVSSGIQYAYMTQSTHDLLLIVGGLAGSSAALSYVDVKINPNELYLG